MELKETLGSAKNFDPEAGMATAEYAIATVAAIGFAGLLVALLKSGAMKTVLENMIQKPLEGYQAA